MDYSCLGVIPRTLPFPLCLQDLAQVQLKLECFSHAGSRLALSLSDTVKSSSIPYSHNTVSHFTLSVNISWSDLIGFWVQNPLRTNTGSSVQYPAEIASNFDSEFSLSCFDWWHTCKGLLVVPNPCIMTESVSFR